ncbi:MAG TPA: hypothetical protein VJA00_02700, partial [Candidatus Omnitrophota bacterium]|nr:hypothetical protein [Candidatus Omnitrophota bacterium]
MVSIGKGLTKKIQKTIAFFLLISFTLLNTSQNSFTYAETLPVSSASHHGIKKANPNALLGSFELPEELGIIQERFIPQDFKEAQKFVIYVQSAHTNYDSESNTKKLIEFFQKDFGLDLVLLEGGAGSLDSLYFKSFPDSETKQKILNDYLKKGDLSGGEIASILNENFDTQYYGIEEPSLYDQNKAAFLKAIEKESDISKRLDQIESNLNGKIDQLSEKAKHFLEKERAFRSEQIDLLEYVKELGPVGSDFPELAKLLQASESEVRIKKGDVDATVTQVIKTFQEKILPKLSKPQQMEMNQMIQMYRLGHLGHGLLIKRIEDLGKSQNLFFDTPEVLKPAVKQAQMISSIKGTKLFDELEAWEGELRETLAQSDEERDILQAHHELRLFRSFARLEVTHKEWQEIQQIAFVKAGLFQSHFDFYHLAEKRDEALFQNAIRMMDQEKAQVALVSTGGFHSEGITKKLKEEKIPYLLVAPKITRFEDRNHYLKVMRDERSFMKYFQGSLWDALAKDYSAKLASSLKQEELTPSLKRWRDRIIQNSIAEGRITEAGTYTRYVDALVQALRKEYEKGSPIDFETIDHRPQTTDHDLIRAQLEKE